MVRRERWLLSRDGRHAEIQVNRSVAHSCNADPVRLPRQRRASADQAWLWCLVQGRQRPAPAGELTGDRNVGDQMVLLALVESTPLLVQAPVAGMPAVLERWVDLAQRARIVGPGLR